MKIDFEERIDFKMGRGRTVEVGGYGFDLTDQHYKSKYTFKSTLLSSAIAIVLLWPPTNQDKTK